MPISAENKARYPKNWPQIREAVRIRSGDKCEVCGVNNGAIGSRDSSGNFCEMGMMESEAAILDGEKVIRIVLTVAHWDDPAPENCNMDNLKHACQRCHLRHDIKHHMASARRTLDIKARTEDARQGQKRMF